MFRLKISYKDGSERLVNISADVFDRTKNMRPNGPEIVKSFAFDTGKPHTIEVTSGTESIYSTVIAENAPYEGRDVKVSSDEKVAAREFRRNHKRDKFSMVSSKIAF